MYIFEGMRFVKKLVTGQLSLPMTFWGWGICVGMLIGLIGMAGIRTGYLFLVPLVFTLKTILFCAVLSGLTLILRKKITVLGAIAFFIVLVLVLVLVIMGIVMVIGFSSLLFK